LGDSKKRSDATLDAGNIVMLRMLFALKGGRCRAFYRWLSASYRA
jgi:hypothetical protein